MLKEDGGRPKMRILEELDDPNFKKLFCQLFDSFKQVDESKIYKPSLTLDYIYGTPPQEKTS